MKNILKRTMGLFLAVLLLWGTGAGLIGTLAAQEPAQVQPAAVTAQPVMSVLTNNCVFGRLAAYCQELVDIIKAILGKTEPEPDVTGLTWPVPDCSTVSSPYGYRRNGFHRGIDISDGKTNGKNIVAAKGGTVELVDLGNTSYGHQVVINHGGGVKTRYAHMMYGSISVAQGERVATGQTIGRVGSTGNSTGPHLHFEVIVNGSVRNPLDYVSP